MNRRLEDEVLECILATLQELVHLNKLQNEILKQLAKPKGHAFENLSGITVRQA